MNKIRFYLLLFVVFQSSSLLVTAGTIVGSAIQKISPTEKTALIVALQSLGALFAILFTKINLNKIRSHIRIDHLFIFFALASSCINYFSVTNANIWYLGIFVRQVSTIYLTSTMMASAREFFPEQVYSVNKSLNILNTFAYLISFAFGPLVVTLTSMKSLFLVDILFLVITSIVLLISKLNDMGLSHDSRPIEELPEEKKSYLFNSIFLILTSTLVWSVAGLFHILEVPILNHRFQVTGAQISIFFILPLASNILTLKLINMDKIHSYIKKIYLFSSIIIILISIIYFSTLNFFLATISLIFLGVVNGFFNITQTSLIQNIESKLIRAKMFLYIKLTSQAGLGLSAIFIFLTNSTFESVSKIVTYATLMLLFLMAIVGLLKNKAFVKLSVTLLFGLLITTTKSFSMDTSTTFKYPVSSLPDTLDPTHAKTVTDVLINNQMFDTLYKYDGSNLLKPVLVKNHTISSDGLTISITLKDNIFFSDQTPLTSTDVIRSLKRTISLHKESLAWALSEIKGYFDYIKNPRNPIMIKSISPHKIQIHLIKPFPKILQALSSSYFSIYKINKKNNFIGTGRYVLFKKSKNFLTLVRKNKFEKSPYKLIFELISQSKKGLSYFDIEDVTGKNNMISKKKNKIEFHFLHTIIVFLNNKSSTFKNSENRCRFSDDLQNEVNQNDYGIVKLSTGAPFIKDFFDDNQITKMQKPFEKPLSVELLYTNSFVTFSEKFNDNLKKALKLKGIDIHFKFVEVKQLLKKLKTGDYQAAMLGYGPDYLDPEALLTPILKTGQQYNFSKYSNSKLDLLLDQLRIARLPKQRLLKFRQIKTVMDNECPVAILGTQNRTFLINPKWIFPKVSNMGIHTLDFSKITPRLLK